MKTDSGDRDLDRLFAAARKAELYKTEREFGFETRVLARIRATRTENRPFPVWAWRLMPFFVSVVICLAIWLSLFEPSRASDLIAGAGSDYEDAMVVSYLAGE